MGVGGRSLGLSCVKGTPFLWLSREANSRARGIAGIEEAGERHRPTCRPVFGGVVGGAATMFYAEYCLEVGLRTLFCFFNHLWHTYGLKSLSDMLADPMSLGAVRLLRLVYDDSLILQWINYAPIANYLAVCWLIAQMTPFCLDHRKVD